MKNALVYNPSLHVLGGGERYTFAIAGVLAEAGYMVKVAGPTLPDLAQLAHLGFPTNCALEELPAARFTDATRDTDLLVHLCLRPPEPSKAKRSFLVVQFPWEPLPSVRHPRAWLRARMGLPAYQCVVYSDFVRHWLGQWWGREAEILHPLVELGAYRPALKEPLILNVGRFVPRKRQDVVIEAFLRLPDDIRAKWRLMIVGGADMEDASAAEYLGRLRDMAGDERNIKIEPNLGARELNDLYTRASLYWHAAGYGRRADRPQEVEHFGISIVEAMSYGGVPLVFRDGGAVEIVTPGCGRQWNSLAELVDYTALFARSPAALRETATLASARSLEFGPDRFRSAAQQVFGLGG